MPDGRNTDPPYLPMVSCGVGARFDPSALARLLDADPGFAPKAARRRASGGADQQSAVARRDPAGCCSTTFTGAGAMQRLDFVGGAAPRVSLGEGFVRIAAHPRSRAHGAWADAGGDGVYRALVRWSGADLAHGPERRICFGVRVARHAGGYAGVRVDACRTTGGAPRLQIREYLGDGTKSVSLATRAAPWSPDAWHWIEMEVRGADLRARIYAEAAAPPDWQIRAPTARIAAGAFGPGILPGGGAGPVLDLRRLEYRAVTA